jgi:hypothetical protein
MLNGRGRQWRVACSACPLTGAQAGAAHRPEPFCRYLQLSRAARRCAPGAGSLRRAPDHCAEPRIIAPGSGSLSRTSGTLRPGFGSLFRTLGTLRRAPDQCSGRREHLRPGSRSMFRTPGTLHRAPDPCSERRERRAELRIKEPGSGSMFRTPERCAGLRINVPDARTKRRAAGFGRVIAPA